MITREFAETICQMNTVCHNEGIGPDSRNLIRFIFENYPDLKIKYGHLWKDISDYVEAVSATNRATMLHINRVRELLHLVVSNLYERAEVHDASKLESPEVEALMLASSQLAGLTYGSSEYFAQLNSGAMAEYLEHHYANNPHHPEFWQNGVNDMSLLDLVEMLVDWKAASERHTDGDIIKSIELNTSRFGLTDQMAQVFKNTVRELF